MTGIKIALKNKTEGSVGEAVATAISFCEMMGITPTYVKMRPDTLRRLHDEIPLSGEFSLIENSITPEAPYGEIFGLRIALDQSADTGVEDGAYLDPSDLKEGDK